MLFWIFLIFLECSRKFEKIKKIKKNTWKSRNMLENPRKFKNSPNLLLLFVKIRKVLEFSKKITIKNESSIYWARPISDYSFFELCQSRCGFHITYFFVNFRIYLCLIDIIEDIRKYTGEGQSYPNAIFDHEIAVSMQSFSQSLKKKSLCKNRRVWEK